MKKFVHFALAGGIAALVNFGSRIVFSRFVDYEAAILLAFPCGLTAAFLLNRAFVFPVGNAGLHKQVAWFIAVNLFAVVQTLVISVVLARFVFPATGFTFYPESVAHAIGIIAPIFTSYIGHKKFTFRTR